MNYLLNAQRDCREFEPSWNAVAKAWTKVARSDKDTHFFATLDFDNAPTVFQRVCAIVVF